MAKLAITKDWAGPKGTMKAGSYEIPREISMTHAKCCVADGNGEITQGEAGPRKPATFRKGDGAPENKLRDTDDKARTLTKGAVRGGSDRAKPDK